MARPKLIIFDLDCTLWPFHVECQFTAPYRIAKKGQIKDARNQDVDCYPDVPKMLKQLSDDGYILGVASRTTSGEEAEDLVALFGWEKYFKYKQIYPGCKVPHFNRFHAESGIPYKDMLFFDDEYRNIQDVSPLGVTCLFASEGMSFDVLKEGLEKFRENH